LLTVQDHSEMVDAREAIILKLGITLNRKKDLVHQHNILIMEETTISAKLLEPDSLLFEAILKSVIQLNK